MSERITAFVRRVEGDPFFLASAMNEYAHSENLDDSRLAALLGCSVDTLSSVALCRRPRPEPSVFRHDVNRIAERFNVRADALAEIVRRADVLMEMQRIAPTERGLLMAARDAEQNDEHEDERRDKEQS